MSTFTSTPNLDSNRSSPLPIPSTTPQPQPPTPATPLQTTYATASKTYTQSLSTPLGTLEHQLLSRPLSHLPNYQILDLGGGTGLRSRTALSAGARHVDVLDISPEMMAEGQDYENSIGRDPSWISWYVADVSRDLSHLCLLPNSYDMVIANGIFDHAASERELDGMFANAAKYLKPRGVLVANRNNPFSGSAKQGDYGVTFSDHRPLPNGQGISYKYTMATDPPLTFDSMALTGYASGSLEIPARYFEGFENVEWEGTEVVRRDEMGFWEGYIEDPILWIWTARKRG